VKARAERLSDAVVGAGLDLLVVTDLVNVRYVTGYSGTNGLAVVGPRTRAFLTDFRYIEQAAEEVHASFERRRAQQDLLESVAEVLPEGRIRLGFEDARMPVSQHKRLRELLPERVELVPAGGLIERLRSVKEPVEVEAIRAATQLADAAWVRLLRGGLEGRTERSLAIELEHDMRERGAERPSFDTIIAAGPHGALPHAQPRNAEIRRGDLVVIDWGAELGGYCSDCTRTVSVGPPSEDVQRVYDLVLEAQQVGLAAVRAGESGREVDSVAREVISAGGHGDDFGHGLGHGVGIDIHEAPRLAQSSKDVLSAGNVVTVEPGIYLAGRFGVRIEDLVVVTEDGCEILTSIPKQLIVTD
jgi:Xaa-Pro aminopeptidase